MNRTEIIELNKFAELHDSKQVIFCKTDFLDKEFEYIKSLSNKVILITGNSDYGITDQIASQMPKNISHWYAQNCLTKYEKVFPLPIGIENRYECSRSGHGIGYPDRVEIKEQLLSRNLNIIPDKLIYANFAVHSNPEHRTLVKNICKETKFIDFENANLAIDSFFNRILDYKMVVCPAGNGMDTHRLWEVLYSKRIPITIKTGNYKIYDMYEKLPIIILNSIGELKDRDLILEKYNQQLLKNNQEILFSYWKNKILKNKEQLND